MSLPSLSDRRRSGRFVVLQKSIVMLVRRGLFKTRRQVTFDNATNCGVALNTKWVPTAGMRAVLLCPGSSGVQVECRWVRHDSLNISSGWIVLQTDRDAWQAILNTMVLSARGVGDRRKGDRRNRSNGATAQNQRRQSRRLAESQSVSPLDFFLDDLNYRRESDRRGKERRGQNVPVSSDRRRGKDKRKSSERSAVPRSPIVVKHTVTRTLTKAIAALRDYVVLWMPTQISRRLIKPGEFAFITHPRDTSDVQRQFPLAKLLPESVLQFWLRWQWPVVGVRIKGVRNRDGKEIQGWIIFCPLTAKQMIRNRDLARKRVLETVKLASKMGAKIVGLGAFTSIVTKDGLDVIDRFPLNITTGNALSAAGAIQNVAAAAHVTELDLRKATVAIVGAAGNVGSACARVFAEIAPKLILVDINQRALQRVVTDLQSRTIVEVSAAADAVRGADVVIAVTNAPGAVVRAEHLKPGAIVVDAAQPKNVSDKVPSQRKDVLVMESSVFRFPGIDYAFDLGIGRGEALGCMAETIVLAGAGSKKNYSVGQLSAQQVKDIYSAARLLGIKIGYFRTSSGLTDEDRIREVIRARQAEQPESVAKPDTHV